MYFSSLKIHKPFFAIIDLKKKRSDHRRIYPASVRAVAPLKKARPLARVVWSSCGPPHEHNGFHSRYSSTSRRLWQRRVTQRRQSAKMIEELLIGLCLGNLQLCLDICSLCLCVVVDNDPDIIRVFAQGLQFTLDCFELFVPDPNILHCVQSKGRALSCPT